MARFQVSFKIALACVLSIVLLLFFFRQSVSLPQLPHGNYGNSAQVPSGSEVEPQHGTAPTRPDEAKYEHDVFSDSKDFDLEDSIAHAVASTSVAEHVAAPHATVTAGQEQVETITGRTDFWTMELGDLLPGDKLTSQNGLYTMNLSFTGELKIYRHYADQPAKPLFWTNNDFQWVGSKYAQIGEDGIFQTWHRIENGDNGQGDDELGVMFHEELKKLELGVLDKRLSKRGYEPWEGPFRTWSTISYPECQKTPGDGMMAVVILTDTGALQIKHLRTADYATFKQTSTVTTQDPLLKPICEVFEGEKEAMGGDMGKLAVVLAGTMRSWKRCCKHLNEKVLDQWPGSGGVDVFVATGDSDVFGYETDEEVPWLEIQDELNRCLHGRLRLLEHVPLETETFPDLESTGGKCNGGVTSQHRLMNQVKTLFRGGALVQKYSIRTGTIYDYVLKMRPDHMIWGDSISPFEPLPADVIKYPMPYWEPPTWSMRHDRTAHSTPSDQMAFGRLLPMMTYLNLFPSYVNVIRTSQEEGSQDYPPCYVPNVPCPDWEGHSPCFIEGLSGYWPVLNGIKVMLDWRWKVNLLREGEAELSKDWKVPWNRTQGTKYVENGYE